METATGGFEWFMLSAMYRGRYCPAKSHCRNGLMVKSPSVTIRAIIVEAVVPHDARGRWHVRQEHDR